MSAVDIEELSQNPSDYLYAVRDAAGQAADELKKAIERASAEADDARGRLERAIATAEAAAAELARLATRMEQAAELVAASDLEPNSSSVVPGEAGLTRISAENALTLEHLHALPDHAYVRDADGDQWYHRGRYWARRGAPSYAAMPSDVLYSQHGPIHLLENGWPTP